jgi:hypothetical protein
VADLFINGIDGDTGEYLVAPLTYHEAAKFVRDEPLDAPLTKFLKIVWQKISQPHLGLPAGVDAGDVTKAGWGVVFHADEDPQVKAALTLLVAHRQAQISDDTIVKVLEYDGQENAREWLASYGVEAGSVQPWKVPYYLLLVGSPARIPFSFGHVLDVGYAVGRLHFDEAADYAQYVDSLTAYESGKASPRGKEAVFFGTCHQFDKATQLSAEHLVDPLADGVPAGDGRPAQPGVAEGQGFQTRKIRDQAATREALSRVLAPPAGMRPPAFLFTATHGIGLRKRGHDQVARHGALVCQEWPGPGVFEEDYYFAAKDLPAESQVHGLITFHFACFSAGTPSHDRFMHKPGKQPRQIAEEPFIAALPKALLIQPQGGALACVGHVERAWGFSFTTEQTGTVIQPFQNAIHHILAGKPVGFAMKDFNDRYAELSTVQSDLLEQIDFGKQVSDKELVTIWSRRNDAEGYMVVGDPAAALRVNELV